MTTSHMSTATDTTHTVLSQDGAKISYLTTGSGPSVLIIPGALSMAADYAAFASALSERSWWRQTGGQRTQTASNERFERRSKQRQEEEGHVYRFGRIYASSR